MKMPNAAETIEKLTRSDERKTVYLERFIAIQTEDEELKKLQSEVKEYLSATRN